MQLLRHEERLAADTLLLKWVCLSTSSKASPASLLVAKGGWPVPKLLAALSAACGVALENMGVAKVPTVGSSALTPQVTHLVALMPSVVQAPLAQAVAHAVAGVGKAQVGRPEASLRAEAFSVPPPTPRWRDTRLARQYCRSSGPEGCGCAACWHKRDGQTFWARANSSSRGGPGQAPAQGEQGVVKGGRASDPNYL